MAGHFLYRRREFITILGGAAVVWPLTAPGQQSVQMRRIGFIIGATEENDPESQTRVKSFREGLAALGWIEGRNKSSAGEPNSSGNIETSLDCQLLSSGAPTKSKT
jgi:hypothetical protein